MCPDMNFVFTYFFIKTENETHFPKHANAIEEL